MLGDRVGAQQFFTMMSWGNPPSPHPSPTHSFILTHGARRGGGHGVAVGNDKLAVLQAGLVHDSVHGTTRERRRRRHRLGPRPPAPAPLDVVQGQGCGELGRGVV